MSRVHYTSVHKFCTEKECGTILLTIQKLKQMSHVIAFVKGVVDEKTWNVYTVHFLY